MHHCKYEARGSKREIAIKMGLDPSNLTKKQLDRITKVSLEVTSRVYSGSSIYESSRDTERE